MKLFLSFVFMFCALGVYAQDYYLTKEKNKTPLAVESVEGIAKTLKSLGKDGKYKPVILSKNAAEAVYVLAPVSLNTDSDEDLSVISNYDQSEEEISKPGAFAISAALKNEPEDIKSGIKEYSEEYGEEIRPQYTKRTYGRINYDVCSFSTKEAKIIILTAPYNGKYISFNYMASPNADPKSVSGAKISRGEAALGIIASSLNRAVFASGAAKQNAVQTPKISEPAAAPAEERTAPVLEDWSSKNISAREVQFSFNIAENDKTYSYIMTLPVGISAKPEGKEDARIILKQEADALMWLEPVFKNSRSYNDEVLAKYAPGKKFTQNPTRKIKIAGKGVNFVRKTALNVNASSYFFAEGGRRFVLSFVTPSSKLTSYESAASAVLNKFKSAD